MAAPSACCRPDAAVLEETRDQEVTRMVARVGDRIVVESVKAGVAPREGVILEVIKAAWGTSYRVRWTTGHESTVRPSAGTVRTTRPREGHPA